MAAPIPQGSAGRPAPACTSLGGAMRWLSALTLSCGLVACERRYADDSSSPVVPQIAPTTAPSATAVTGDGIEVGPGKKLPNLQSVAPLLGPGDVVLLMGNTSYRGGVRLTRD